MNYKSGFAHVLVILIIVLATLALIWFLVAKGKISIPGFTKKPSVELKTTYENPFKKETQYVNPFKQYKNPFNNI